jgi:hypothetical protein
VKTTVAVAVEHCAKAAPRRLSAQELHIAEQHLADLRKVCI